MNTKFAGSLCTGKDTFPSGKASPAHPTRLIAKKEDVDVAMDCRCFGILQYAELVALRAQSINVDDLDKLKGRN